MKALEIEKPEGKLGVLIVGLNGAVSSTFIAGTLGIVSGNGNPIGSLTQMGTVRIGARRNNNFPFIKDFVPLANISDFVFGGWDIYNQNCYDAAAYAHVLDEKDIKPVENEL